MNIWQKETKLPSFKKLCEDISVDVLIVGGGLAGILCAKLLNDNNINYALIEQDTICSKTTQNTTAKITCQHGFFISKLIKQSREKVQLYMSANKRAVESYKKLCANIDCDFEIKDSYIYSFSKEKIENELSALAAINASADYFKALPLPFKTAGGVCIKNQAQFNPWKFTNEISKELNIYEHTKALEFFKDKVKTQGGTITAKKIIIATHFPIINKHGAYFLKMYQHRSLVTALKGVDLPDGMFADENDKGFSFRSYGDYLIVGGGGHRTGKAKTEYDDFNSFLNKYYPKVNRVCNWAAQDCMTLDSVPYIGKYSKRSENLYVATGFNKWGITSSMVAAELLLDLITGRQNDYEKLYSPQRSMLYPQLAINAFESTAKLIYPTTKRCPHLGCALKYNKYEHSYDCSCHGSRFSQDGELLDGPATDGKKKI